MPSPVPFSFRSVMLVDEDEISLFICEKLMLLYRFSNKIYKFTKPEEALQWLGNAGMQCPDLIMIAGGENTVSNLEFLQRLVFFINQAKLPAQVILLSNFVTPADLTVIESLNGDIPYYLKPLTKEQLYDIAERFAGKSP